MAFRTARQPAEIAAAERPQPLMEVAARAARSLGELDADLRAGGFGRNCRGLARELYASFTATVLATRRTESETMAWALVRALAIDLDSAGARRAALALLYGLIEFGGNHADPKVLAGLRESEAAIDQKTGWRRRAAARAGQEPTPPAVKSEPAEPVLDPLPAVSEPIAPVKIPLAPAPNLWPAAPDLFAETGLSVASGDRLVPRPSDPRLPDPLLRHTRSRRGWEFAAGATTALMAVGLFFLATTHDLSPPQPAAALTTAAMPPPAAPPAGEAPLENASSPLPTSVPAVTEVTDKQVRALTDLQSYQGAALVQGKLKDLGFYRGKVDGAWGQRSAAALLKFRKKKGLGPGALWDRVTQSALLGD